MRSTTGELRDETIWIESNGAANRIQYTFCVIWIIGQSLTSRLAVYIGRTWFPSNDPAASLQAR
jgi:hypothetical protein